MYRTRVYKLKSYVSCATYSHPKKCFSTLSAVPIRSPLCSLSCFSGPFTSDAISAICIDTFKPGVRHSAWWSSVWLHCQLEHHHSCRTHCFCACRDSLNAGSSGRVQCYGACRVPRSAGSCGRMQRSKACASFGVPSWRHRLWRLLS